MTSTKGLLARLRDLRRGPAGSGASRGRVAVWGDPASEAVRSVAAGRPGDRVLVLDPHSEEGFWHARLAGAGPFELVVDASGRATGAAARFRSSFLHLQRGGRYRVPADTGAAAAVTALTNRLADGAGSLKQGSAKSALAAALGHVQAGAGGLEVRRRGTTLAKLRETEMNAALAHDGSRGRVLEAVAAVSFESRCSLTTSRPRDDDRTPGRYDAPELFLREYHDVVCRPKSVVEQRGLLTPDTYRHHLARRLTHKQLRDAGPQFAVAPRPREVTDRLEGTYFHVDNEMRGFFGHALTEQLSHAWAWPRVRQLFPGARALVSLNRGRPVAEWEWTLLAAAGIARDDVVVIGGPVRVERLVAATPMFSMPEYVHPEIVSTWDSVGAALRSSSGLAEHPKRIFLSRRHDRRACLNRAEVEGLFTEHGFEIVFPEDHPLADQVELVHGAQVVAGFAGSAMFTTMLTDRLTHVVLVSSDTYRPTNEYLIASVRGHRLDVAIGTTSTVLANGVPDDRLEWPFHVDMDEEGAWLKEVLARLDRG
jgi:capsular polysaccharide biosynthesis protein